VSGVRDAGRDRSIAAVASRSGPEVTLCSFGDMLRVPGTGATTCSRFGPQGGDVRIVYSPLDAVALARATTRTRQVVFLAVGFETTAPANAMAVWQARAGGAR
jgi:hydrogenase expression/formation protein HypD